MTGTLHAVGRPGGLFHYHQGLVMAVLTPGAPGPETLLTRTGRIAPPEEEPPEEGRRIGPAELEIVRTVSAYDAVFAIMVGTVQDCVLRAGDGPAPAGRGEEPERLVREALRRVDALRSLPDAVLPHDDLVAVAPGVDREGTGRPPIRREILLLANGRRTCRDIAYATAHGVYAVAVEVSRMLAEGLLERAAPGGRGPSGAVGPLLPRGPEPRSPLPQPPQSLPRRTRGRGGPDPSRAEKHTRNWADFARFRDLTR